MPPGKGCAFLPRELHTAWERASGGNKGGPSGLAGSRKSQVGVRPGAVPPAAADPGHHVHEAASVPQVGISPPFHAGRARVFLPPRHGVYGQEAERSGLNRLSPGYFHRAGAAIAVAHQHDGQPGAFPAQLFQLRRNFSAPVQEHAAAAPVPVVIGRGMRHPRQKPGNLFSTRLRQPATTSPKPPMNTAR